VKRIDHLARGYRKALPAARYGGQINPVTLTSRSPQRAGITPERVMIPQAQFEKAAGVKVPDLRLGARP
jgi:hypothetical protein